MSQRGSSLGKRTLSQDVVATGHQRNASPRPPTPGQSLPALRLSDLWNNQVLRRCTSAPHPHNQVSWAAYWGLGILPCRAQH